MYAVLIGTYVHADNLLLGFFGVPAEAAAGERPRTLQKLDGIAVAQTGMRGWCIDSGKKLSP